MTNTPEHIKALQLKIWLSKPPAERLRQMTANNEALIKFCNNAKKKEQTEDAEVNQIITSLHNNIIFQNHLSTMLIA